MAMVNVVSIAAYRRIYWLRLIGLIIIICLLRELQHKMLDKYIQVVIHRHTHTEIETYR